MKKYIIALFMLLGMALSASAQKNMDHHFEVGKHLDIFNQVYKNLELLYVDTLSPKETIGTGINAQEPGSLYRVLCAGRDQEPANDADGKVCGYRCPDS